MKTTTDEAREIRAELKKVHGWTSRQISVRTEYFSLGSAIDVTVNDPTIPLAPVEKIAKRAESVRYCESTHEILSGGNTYVSVEYSHEAMAARATQYAETVQAALDGMRDGTVEPITDGVKIRKWNGRIELRFDGRQRLYAYNAQEAAETIARVI